MTILNKNFGLGAAVGSSIVAGIAFALTSTVSSPGGTNGTEVNTNLYIHGLVSDISEDNLILDQSFNRTVGADAANYLVTINLQGAALFDCRYNPNPTCIPTEFDRVAKGAHVCAHVYATGSEYIGGKIFANSVCTIASPPRD